MSGGDLSVSSSLEDTCCPMSMGQEHPLAHLRRELQGARCYEVLRSSNQGYAFPEGVTKMWLIDQKWYDAEGNDISDAVANAYKEDQEKIYGGLPEFLRDARVHNPGGFDELAGDFMLGGDSNKWFGSVHGTSWYYIKDGKAYHPTTFEEITEEARASSAHPPSHRIATSHAHPVSYMDPQTLAHFNKRLDRLESVLSNLEQKIGSN